MHRGILLIIFDNKSEDDSVEWISTFMWKMLFRRQRRHKRDGFPPVSKVSLSLLLLLFHR